MSDSLLPELWDIILRRYTMLHVVELRHDGTDEWVVGRTREMEEDDAIVDADSMAEPAPPARTVRELLLDMEGKYLEKEQPDWPRGDYRQEDAQLLELIKNHVPKTLHTVAARFVVCCQVSRTWQVYFQPRWPKLYALAVGYFTLIDDKRRVVPVHALAELSTRNVLPPHLYRGATVLTLWEARTSPKRFKHIIDTAPNADHKWGNTWYDKRNDRDALRCFYTSQPLGKWLDKPGVVPLLLEDIYDKVARKEIKPGVGYYRVTIRSFRGEEEAPQPYEDSRGWLEAVKKALSDHAKENRKVEEYEEWMRSVPRPSKPSKSTVLAVTNEMMNQGSVQMIELPDGSRKRARIIIVDEEDEEEEEGMEQPPTKKEKKDDDDAIAID